MKIIAQILSLIFQPTLAVALTFLVIQSTFPSLLLPFVNEYFLPFIYLIFFSTYILPSIGILVLKFTKNIETFSLDSKIDRTKVSISICVIWCASMLMIILKFPLSKSLILILVFQVLIIFLVSILNYFYKFSLHTFGIIFPTVWLALSMYKSTNFYLINYLYFLILVCGIVGWARLYLSKHTPQELVVGYLAGGISSAILWQLV